ncbi:putative uncharacterized protein [Enterocloster bolteae CAG:59]|nr:putative uncharacterized protein [Enterocloster bolteae CAG:59]
MGNSGRKGGRPLGRRRTGCAGGAGLSGAGPVCCRKMNIKTGISILEIPVFCLQKMGVEPTRYYYHTDLNRARLPIPPLLHFVLFCCFVQATKVIINE